jgi:hypothetical protein
MGQFRADQGLNTAQDRTYLNPGELILATGAYYRPGDTFRLWKILGRTNYGTAYAGKHAPQGVALFPFDAVGTDRLVVYNDNGEYHASIVSATDPTSGTFTTLTTGFTTGSTVLSWAHFNDIWYFCNSKNAPLAMNSDGTVRRMGMEDPAQEPICTATTGGSYTGRVTTATYTGSEWVNPASGYDADLDTYAYSWLRDTDASGDTHTILFSGAASTTAANRVLMINWSLQGAIAYGDAPTPAAVDRHRPGQEFRVRTIIEKSENAGSTWTTLLDGLAVGAKAQQFLQSAISANSDQIQVRATFKQMLANPTKGGAFRIHDIKLTNEGTQAVFTTTDGVYYGISEYDEEHDLESPVLLSKLVTLASQDQVIMALPPQVNAHATHFKIYRTHDGGFVMEIIPITETSWTDHFDKPIDNSAGEVAPVLKVQLTDEVPTYYSSNNAPQAFKAIVEYQNFMVGISEQSPRQLNYSLPGEPEYWPTLYTIIDFPLKEHDQLQALGVAGDLLLVGATEALIVINGLPELEAQSYANASMTVMRGAPGCVGPRAMTEYSLHGEPRVVYVAEQGIYETNGHQVRELSGDLDWATTVSRGNLANTWLFWDKEDQIIIMGVDTNDDGYPDREYWLHMADEHKKQNGRPKITGPHYSDKVNMVGGLSADGRYRVYSANRGVATGNNNLTEAQILALNPELWYDANDPIGDGTAPADITDGTEIESLTGGHLTDKSGNARHMTSSQGAGSQPIWHKTAGSSPKPPTLSGTDMPSLAFVGSRGMGSDQFSTITLADGYTAFAVVHLTSDAGPLIGDNVNGDGTGHIAASLRLQSLNGATWSRQQCSDLNYGGDYLINYVANTDFTATPWAVVMFARAPTVFTGTHEINDTNIAVDNQSNQNFLLRITQAMQDVNNVGTIDRCGMWMNELLVFNTNLSTADKAAVKQYLEDKWSVNGGTPTSKDRTVYHEKDGGADSGNFYTTITNSVPLDVQSGRVYGPLMREWSVDFPVIRHTSWNNTALSITWTAGRDEIGETDSVVNTMTLSTQGQTKFAVARSGEWHQVRFQHTGNASTGASIGVVEHRGIPTGDVGDTQDS